MEPLEGRQLMSATYFVTGVGDAAGTVTQTGTNQYNATTLRAAITAINKDKSSGVDTIDFNIPAGSLTIYTTSPLPAINHSVLIDGNSQPKSNLIPKIEIDGRANGGGSDALVLNAGGSTVRGLSIDHFSRGVVANSSSDVITQNSFGTLPTTVNGADEGFDNAVDVFGSNTKVTNNVIQTHDGFGVSIESGSNSNQISQNTISFTVAAIDVSSGSVHNTIHANSIFSNEVLGIELDGTANDMLPAPTLTGATSLDNLTNTITGTFNGPKNSTYQLEFFSSPAGQSSAGETFQGYVTVGTDSSGRLLTASAPTGSNASVSLTGSGELQLQRELKQLLEPERPSGYRDRNQPRQRGHQRVLERSIRAICAGTASSDLIQIKQQEL